MRTNALGLLFLLLAGPALAGDAPRLARRVPAGPTAYFEVRGLADRADRLLASPLADTLAKHPAIAAFLQSPEGQKLVFGHGVVTGLIGVDARGLVKAVGRGEIAGAMYGSPAESLLLVEMEATLAQRIVGGIEFVTSRPREEIVPSGDDGAALYRVGGAFVCIEPGVTIVSNSEALARRVREREGEMIAGNRALADARELAGPAPLLFGVLDLRRFHGKLEAGGKPQDFGQALLLGAIPHDLRSAPWAAFSADVQANGSRWELRLDARMPAPAEREEGAREAFGGTLGDLPIALPRGTLGVARMKRDLAQLWRFQDELIAADALPQLVKFSSNFKTLTGLTLSEELLPRLGDEVTLVAVARNWKDGEPEPEVKLPEFALLWPVDADARMRQSLELAFQQVLSLVGLQQSEMSRKFLVLREEYEGVPLMLARYPDPAEGEMKGRERLPLRYNFTPSAAVVGGHYVVASTDGLLKRLIDGRAGSTVAPPGHNAGVWLRPSDGAAMLRANRSALVAQRMLKAGEERAAAERVVDLFVDAVTFAREISFTVDEKREATGLCLRVVLEAPAK